MKLSKEEIKFIDTYLQKSDVIFVDLRAEMTDHIATAVEEKIKKESLSFYDAFKDYMVKNKKELLKSNHKIMFAHYLNAIRYFSRTLYKPYNIILGLLIIIGYSYFNNANILRTVHHVLFLGIFVFSILQFVVTLIVKKRYFYLEKTSFILFVIYYIDLFLNGFGFSEDFYGNYLTIGVTLFLYLAFIIHFFVTINKFRIQYL